MPEREGTREGEGHGHPQKRAGKNRIAEGADDAQPEIVLPQRRLQSKVLCNAMHGHDAARSEQSADQALLLGRLAQRGADGQRNNEQGEQRVGAVVAAERSKET